jgi:release factor glutamine methyltransferase
MLPNDSDILEEFNFFIKERLGKDVIAIFIDNPILSNKDIKEIEYFLNQKGKGVPIDYILNESSFYRDSFYVDNRVLIPRSETEILVDFINNLKLKPELKILDAGTGSGCIGISIAKYNPNITVYGIDYSLDALEVAQINKKNKLLNNFYLINSDWLNCVQEKTINILVSNPPYISKSDPHLEDLKHEPYDALVSCKEGLENFKLISNQASQVLKDDGLLCFEHGYDQSESVKEIMMMNNFKDIRTIFDNQSLPRITLGKI